MMGDLVVGLGLNSKQFTKGLKLGQNSLKKFSRSVTGVGTKLFALGTATVAPFGLAIKAGSDLEETMNKFNVVFGNNSAAVKQWGDDLGLQVGRSREQIARFMASSQDLLVPLGFQDDAALKMSKQITKLSIDLASFNNMQDSDTLRDIQAALTGSGEVMKKYGVIVSEAAVKQRLLAMGLDPKNVTEAEKAQARFALIMAGTTAAQGDAIRSAGSWANQKKALAAEIKNVAGAIGKTLLPVVTPMLSSVKGMVKELGVLIEKHKEYIPFVAGGAAALMVGGAAFVAIGGAAALAGVAVAGFTTVLGVASTALGVILSPIGLVTAAVIAGGAAFLHFSGLGGKAIDFIKSKFPGLGGSAKETFLGIQLGLVRMFEDVKHFFTGVIPAVLMGFSDNWGNTFRTAADFAMTVFINLGKNIRGAMGEIWDFISTGGRDKLSIAWTPLTEGFHNSMKEFVIPSRLKSEFEKQLEQQLIAAKTAASTVVTPEVKKNLGLGDSDSPFVPGGNDKASKGQAATVGAALKGSRDAASTIIRSVSTGVKSKVEEKQLKVAEKMEKNIGKMQGDIRRMRQDRGACVVGRSLQKSPEGSF